MSDQQSNRSFDRKDEPREANSNNEGVASPSMAQQQFDAESSGDQTYQLFDSAETPSIELIDQASPAIVAQSPPRFVNLSEIDRAASGVSNMFLSHQIAMDKDFRLERSPPPEHSLQGQVMSALKQAFWDILQSQLAESPPNFKQALSLLSTVKQDLCGLLLSQQGKLKQEIDEILDLELIKQQAEHGALDFQRYAQYVLSVMARLCAPVRDEQIRELTQSSEVITLFKGIVELLEIMKLDMANFTISQIRPQIVQHSVEYERQKFGEFLNLQTRMGCDGLTNTRRWLKQTCDEFDESSNDCDRKSLVARIIGSAYVSLFKNSSLLSLFPETLAIDQDLILVLQKKLQAFVLTGSALLLVFAALPSLSGQSELKQRSKQHVLLLLHNAGSNEKKDGDQLAGVADYILSEMHKTLEANPIESLSSDKATTLKQQIVDLANPQNRVRTVIQRRVLEFIEQTLGSSSSVKVQIPIGLNVLQDELMELAGCFVKVVSFNRSVFGDQYAEIVEQHLSKQ
jgi:hypothetical protein